MDRRDGWRDMAVPLALHGDGVAISNIRGVASKTADVLSWTSLLGTGQTRRTHFLIWFAFGHLVKTNGLAPTWRTFWRKLAESFRALASGVWPSHNMNGEPDDKAGQPLAGGYWGLIYINRGDLEWMAKHFGLANVAAGRPCSLCRATNRGGDAVPWTDVNDPPIWAEHCISDQALLHDHASGKRVWGIKWGNGGEHRKVLVPTGLGGKNCL